MERPIKDMTEELVINMFDLAAAHYGADKFMHAESLCNCAMGLIREYGISSSELASARIRAVTEKEKSLMRAGH